MFLLNIGITGCKKDRSSIPTMRVLINGIPLTFEDAKRPRFEGELQFIPVREILDNVGCTCVESSNDKSLICTNGDFSIILRENNLAAIINQQDVVYMFASPFFEAGTMYAEMHFLEHIPHCTFEWDEESQSIQIYDYDQLDYGLYFFDGESDGWKEGDAVGTQKFVEGEDNPFFDPSKPTLIWIHGWQNGGVVGRGRPNFRLNSGGIDKYTHQIWKDRSWNVAIFHWLQFADELLPYDAESKINAAMENDVNMRWKKADGSYSEILADATPVAELFAQEYEALTRSLTNPNIRLAGSSFGGQVALHGTERMMNNSVQTLPNRIALLDIAWTSNYVDAQSLYTTEITARAAANVGSSVPIEYYRSSALTTTFTPDELIDHSAFQEMVFDYAGTFGIELKHTIVTHNYLWSFEHETYEAVDETGNSAGFGLSASNTIDDIWLKKGNNFHWKQIGGIDTYTPEDDIFEKRDGAGY